MECMDETTRKNLDEYERLCRQADELLGKLLDTREDRVIPTIASIRGVSRATAIRWAHHPQYRPYAFMSSSARKEAQRECAA